MVSEDFKGFTNSAELNKIFNKNYKAKTSNIRKKV